MAARLLRKKTYQWQSFLMTSIRVCKPHLFYHREYLRHFFIILINWRSFGPILLSWHLQAVGISQVRVEYPNFAF